MRNICRTGTVFFHQVLFGNLYHLNGNEDLEDPSQPGGVTPFSAKKSILRGASISGTAGGPSNHKGPLTIKRMETFHDEIVAKSFYCGGRHAKDGKPSSCGPPPYCSMCSFISRRGLSASTAWKGRHLWRRPQGA